MNIIIAGYFSFPFGSAAASRIRNLALGFRECGAGVHVISIAPTSLPSGALSKFDTFTYEGITFELAAGRVMRAGQKTTRQTWQVRNRSLGKLVWFVQAYTAGLSGYRRIRQRLNETECNALLVYGDGFARVAPLALGARHRSVVSILDVVEYFDSPELFGSRLNPLYWDVSVGNRFSPKLFDGLSVITTELERKYIRRGKQHVLVVPSVENWSDSLASVSHAGTGPFKLLYVGALIARDAPQILLGAMRILAQRGVPVTLDIVGRFSEFAEGRANARLCQEDPLLRTCVNLVGPVNDQELSHRLQAADGLILLRRDAPTEWCSFPTRLVEYLKYSRPTFVSAVGDVPEYLRHNIDAVLLHPSDLQQIADAISTIATCPDRGMALGLQGRQRGAECFDRKQHAARLLNFVDEIRQAKLSV